MRYQYWTMVLCVWWIKWATTERSSKQPEFPTAPEQKTPSEDEILIRYLMRMKHTSPFEMCEIKLHVKLPIFVARQWIRHRTANVNEYSGRYSEMPAEYYIPKEEDLEMQSMDNKQGRKGRYGPEDQVILAMMEQTSTEAFDQYDTLLTNYDLSRELARTILPLSTYTQWYWKIDLKNLLHFLDLRTDSHAQKEIRVYADVMEIMVREWVPMAYRAWVDYQKEAVTFSRMEMDILRGLISVDGDMLDDLVKVSDLSEREKTAFLVRFGG